MTRFDDRAVLNLLDAVDAAAKDVGLIPSNAAIFLHPNPRLQVIISDGFSITAANADFLPEFEENDTLTDVLRSLTATLRVLRAMAPSKPLPIDDDSIYWDTELEDDSIPVVHLPFGDDTARIIDEAQGGVIAYCAVENADRFVTGLRK